jgi:hypothetical protein
LAALAAVIQEHETHHAELRGGRMQDDHAGQDQQRTHRVAAAPDDGVDERFRVSHLPCRYGQVQHLDGRSVDGIPQDLVDAFQEHRRPETSCNQHPQRSRGERQRDDQQRDAQPEPSEDSRDQ